MRLPLLLAAVCGLSLLTAQTTVFSEDFESDGNGTRYSTSVAEFSDGFGDFFLRTDGSDIGSFITYDGASGFYFAAADIDGEVASAEQSVTFSGIDLQGLSSFEFSASLAEDDDGTNQDWDVGDFVHFDYSVDGGAFQPLLWIENDGSTFNSAPLIDTDFDGTGDGAEITSTFATFTSVPFQIMGGGSLDLRVTFNLDSGDEDFAIDDLELVAPRTVLPVTLSSLDARTEGKRVSVVWTTASETGSDYFEVQRSSDGTNFLPLGRSAAQGNSRSSVDYLLYDDNPLEGMNYYRLRQVDIDGSAHLSKVVTVKYSLNGDLSVYPNPAGQWLHLTGAADLNEVTVTSLTGRTLRLPLVDNGIDVSTLASGIYLLRTGKQTLRFVKQ